MFFQSATFSERLHYLFGIRNPAAKNNIDHTIIYQVLRYPTEVSLMQYLALLTMAPDVIVLYLLGILVVRRDLHVIGVLIGTLPCCLLPNLLLRSASIAILWYFTGYLSSFKCIKGHYWQQGLRRLRARRTASIAFACVVALTSMAVQIVLGEMTAVETIVSMIGGYSWGVAWWKIHRKYSPSIYARVSRHWLCEILMIRNTCWISDLTAFECHYEMTFFRKMVERDHAEMFNTEYSPEVTSPVHSNIVS